MSSKKCAKCTKTVYPLEELKCLDKIWHKACFKCWECGMTLNMKNYKGYDKKPYCNAHYPKTKHTEVAETPEMARLAATSKMQSNIEYHGDFEKSKGHYTAIADDPETKRHLHNMEKISTIKYHEDFEKTMKGKKISVTDDPESARLKENMKVISQVQYKGLNEKAAEMENRRVSIGKEPSPIMGFQVQEEEQRPSPYTARTQPGSTTIYNSSQGGKAPEVVRYWIMTEELVIREIRIDEATGRVETTGQRRIGSINDYDPLNDQWGSIATGYGQAQSQGRGQQRTWEETIPAPAPQPQRNEPVQPAHYPAPTQHQMAPAYQPPPPQPAPVEPVAPPPVKGPLYQAMYDYTAADDDEVGFADGDHIVDIEQIDEGWMIGTVERTGARGMLPANYVERIA